MEIDVDVSSFNFMARRYQGSEPIIAEELTKGLTRIALTGVREARGKAPVDTNLLRGSITHEGPFKQGGYIVVKVGTNVKYARPVEFGTAPHVILPKVKKALYWKGADHPVFSVNHPGTKEHPYLRPAMKVMIAATPRIMGDATNRSLTRITMGAK